MPPPTIIRPDLSKGNPQFYGLVNRKTGPKNFAENEFLHALQA